MSWCFGIGIHHILVNTVLEYSGVCLELRGVWGWIKARSLTSSSSVFFFFFFLLIATPTVLDCFKRRKPLPFEMDLEVESSRKGILVFLPAPQLQQYLLNVYYNKVLLYYLRDWDKSLTLMMSSCYGRMKHIDKDPRCVTTVNLSDFTEGCDYWGLERLGKA